MNSEELEAAADKQAYPWECRVCWRVFHYMPRKKSTFGPVCFDCWQIIKQRAYDESVRIFKDSNSKSA